MSQNSVQSSAKKQPLPYLFSGYLRIAVAIIIVAVLVFEAWGQVNDQVFDSLNFLTNLGNISAVIFAVVIGFSGFQAVVGEIQNFWLQLLRPATTSYVLTALVFFIYTHGSEAFSFEHLGWNGLVVFILAPIYALLDWILIDDRAATRGSIIALFSVGPIFWLIIVITRGLSEGDGWAPFPLFKPEEGFGSLMLSSLIFFVVFIVVAYVVVVLSRIRKTLIASGQIY